MKKIVFYLMAVLTIMVTACNDDDKKDAFVPVSDIIMDGSDLEVAPNVTVILKATVLPKDATNKKVTWSSSSASVKIDPSTGELTTDALGTATITVTAEDGGKTASRKITVINVPVTGIELLDKELVLAPGAKRTLTAKVLSAAATNKNIIWTSDDESVAIVNSTTGEVTGKKVGETTIWATTEEGGFDASCTVMVELVNLLVNQGFENPDDGSTALAGWTIINGNSTWFASYYGDTTPAIVLGNWNADRQPSSWFSSGNGYDVREVVAGNYACRIAAANTGGIYQVINVTPGTSYMFGADIAYRNNNTANQKIKTGETIKILSVNGDYPPIAEAIIPVNEISSGASTAYSISMDVTGTVTIPEGVTQVRFQIDQRQYANPNSAPLMIIDNCLFVQAPE